MQIFTRALLQLPDRTLLLLGSVLCIIAAWQTVGYYHPDEHFQIWEFANYKLGNIPASELPWEFPARMRPGLQPFLAYCMSKAAISLGIGNPFVHVFLMRLLWGAAALWVYWKWTEWLARDFQNPEQVRWMRLGILFFWLMPYLNIRFSSENTSAVCFFGGLLLILKQLEYPKSRFDWKMAAAGLLLGLAFFFRYQIAFAGIGLVAWLFLQKKLSLNHWLALFIGALLSGALGIILDYWLYGEWVFSPYNYFFSNIMEGKAANFGVMPFWWYLTEMPIELLPPFSIVLLLWVAMGIWHKPKHVLTWCCVPFVIAHTLVGHKEARFMFPLAMPFFFFATVGWEAFKERYGVKTWMVRLFSICLWINAIMLIYKVMAPAKDMAAFSRFLWDWETAHPGSTVHFVKDVPRKHFPLNMPFYEHPNQRQMAWYTDPAYPNDTSALKAGDLMFFIESVPPPTPPPGFQLKTVFDLYPSWVLKNNFNNWQSRTRIWSISQLEKGEQ